MNPNEYQRLAARTICSQLEARQRICVIGGELERIGLMHAVIGMAGEVGELSTAVEKCVWYGQELDKENIREELGDLLWYIAEACTALGDVSLEMIMVANIQKLKVRYPEKYSDSKALEENRDREAEAKATNVIPKKRLVVEDRRDEGIGFVRVNGDVQCHNCKMWGFAVDEFISPYTGVCSKCNLLLSNERRQQTGQGWAEPPEDKLETQTFVHQWKTMSKELNDRFERNIGYGFGVARQIVDTYLSSRDSRLALEFIEGSERRCRAESR